MPQETPAMDSEWVPILLNGRYMLGLFEGPPVRRDARD